MTEERSSSAESQVPTGAWFVRRDDEQFMAPDFAIIEQWCRERRIQPGDLVHHPSFGREWRRVRDVAVLKRYFFQPASTRVWPAGKLALLFVALVPLLLVGLCFAGFLTVGVIEAAREAQLKSASARWLANADVLAKGRKWQQAMKRYEAISDKIEKTSLHHEQARARAGHAACLAMMGERSDAESEFLEALKVDEDLQPVIEFPEAEQAFWSARAEFKAHREAQQEARARKEDAQAATAQSNEMKPRLESAARRYIEHEAGDGHVENISVGDPYRNGAYWAVQVYYVKDDYRGRRAKVTVVLFSPLNFEIVSSRDVI